MTASTPEEEEEPKRERVSSRKKRFETRRRKGRRERTVDSVVHHEPSSVGDPLSLLLIRSLVVVGQANGFASSSAKGEKEEKEGQISSDLFASFSLSLVLPLSLERARKLDLQPNPPSSKQALPLLFVSTPREESRRGGEERRRDSSKLTKSPPSHLPHSPYKAPSSALHSSSQP